MVNSEEDEFTLRKNEKSKDDSKEEDDEGKEETSEVVALEPPPPLIAELKSIIDVKFSEFSQLRSRMDELERAEQERIKRAEEEKRLNEIELSMRTPDVVLESLHKVIRNPEIINYLEKIGRIVVFEADRGHGKNRIIFSKIDLTGLKNEIERLIEEKDDFEASDEQKEDKDKEIEEMGVKILEKQKELEKTKSFGGSICLYVGEDKTMNVLNYYSEEDKIRNQSLAILRVYFGKNEVFDDLFHLFNTPELIMKCIHENLTKGVIENEITRLKNKLESR